MLCCAQRSAVRHVRAQLQPSRALRPQQTPFARLLSSLAVLEQREGKLNTASLSAVTAAQQLGESITGFVAGSGLRAVAEEAAKVKGIEKIIIVENGAYDKVCSDCGEVLAVRGTDRFLGSARELRSDVGRECQEGRLHACLHRSFGVWQEPHA